MLQKLTDRIFFLPYEERTDRPCLYYIRGDRLSLAVDVGNAPAHLEKFYSALDAAALPRPDITVITHWHWDHTFALCCTPGVTMASEKTNRKLREVQRWVWTDAAMDMWEATGEDIAFCSRCIRLEYPDLSAIRVVPAAVSVTAETEIDLGGVTCRLIPCDSPHSRDALLIHIPEENCLCIGDAACEDHYDNNGRFDPDRLDVFIRRLEEIGAEHILEGHGDPLSLKELLSYLREEQQKL